MRESSSEGRKEEKTEIYICGGQNKKQWPIRGIRRGKEKVRHNFENLCLGGYGDCSTIKKKQRKQENRTFGKLSRVSKSNEFKDIHEILVELSVC